MISQQTRFVKIFFLFVPLCLFGVLENLVGVDLDADAHGGSHGAGTDILALGGGGLGLDDGADQGLAFSYSSPLLSNSSYHK